MSPPPSTLLEPKPRQMVQFAIDDDSDDELLTTARSSPAPPASTPLTSVSRSSPLTTAAAASHKPYSDDPYEEEDDRNGSSHHIINSRNEEESDANRTPHIDNERGANNDLSYYPPASLKSTIPSREAEFDLDSDELDASDDEDSGGAEPLMMAGLLQTSAARRSGEFNRPSRSGAEGGGAGNENVAKDLEAVLGDNPPEWLRKGAGVLAGIANMSNSILGAGIIGLPYALREAGFFSGLLLLLGLGIVTDWTIRLIVLNAKMSGRNTYIDIMDTCFGRSGRAAVSFFQFAFAFGGMCAFCVIIGDTIPAVLVAVIPGTPGNFLSFLISRQFVISFLTLAISYPLSLYRDIEKLSKASALALVSMVVIVVSVAIGGPGVDAELKGDPEDRWSFVNSGFFEAIGVMSFAFVCHHNSLLIYGSLRTPTLDRFAQVTHVSTTLSVLACLCMSTSGFLVFTSKTQGNILNNFSADDTLINIARACFGLNMFTTLPLEAFVCREVMETYFWPDQPFSQRRHIAITTCLVFSATVVALITCDLGLILELAGGFSATALAYIFPAACYLNLSGESVKLRKTRLAAWLCVGFGVSVMILSTVLSVKKALKGSSHKTC